MKFEPYTKEIHFPLFPIPTIRDILARGWHIPKNTVDTGTLLPSARCISETFNVSIITAKRVLNMVRMKNNIHKPNIKIRKQRGDSLQKFLKRLQQERKAMPNVKKYFKGVGYEKKG